MRLVPVVLALIAASSCASRRGAGHFRVLAAEPNYLLRSPDLRNLPFPDVLASYTGVGDGWVELRPHMQLRIENAYFQTNAPERSLKYYVGTGTARYRVANNGALRSLPAEPSLPRPPRDQPAARDLVPPSMARLHYHRYYYQIVFRSKAAERGAVLLAANSEDELQALGHRLAVDPDSLCTGALSGCVVFPKTCTVSLEIEIVVNGAARAVIWGSPVASVVLRPRRLRVMRIYAGRLTPVEIQADDPQALKLPLLPGDQVTWE